MGWATFWANSSPTHLVTLLFAHTEIEELNNTRVEVHIRKPFLISPLAAHLSLDMSQSYDRELQRQRCKNLQSHKYLAHFHFENKTIFFYLEKNSSVNYNAGVAVVNTEVLGLAPGEQPRLRLN
jgi:hypothetical protein